MRVLGRTYSEPDRETFRILYRDHGHTLDRFRVALARALPSLPEDQLVLRFHFALGALAYTMERASEAADRAVEALTRVPDTVYKESLLRLARFSVERRY